ncbi:hypothetical protein HDU86_007500 [Geranomyces michiganensis]|nr:hypothetical protein HDU86_007500 [Geranomyces michiganensis]
MRFATIRAFAVTALCSSLAASVQAQKPMLKSDGDNVLNMGESIVSSTDASVALTYRDGGQIVLTVGGRSYDQMIVVKGGDDPNTLLKLDNTGFLIATNANEDVLWKSASKTGGSSRPFEITVDNDRRARIRDADFMEVWSWPAPRANVPFLQSNRMGYMRSQESMSSDNGRFIISLNEFGELSANDGTIFRKSGATGQEEPHMLILSEDGLLQLVDLDNRVRWSDGVKGNVRNGPFTFLITNAGVAQVQDGNSNIIWSLVFRNQPNKPTPPPDNPTPTQAPPKPTPTPDLPPPPPVKMCGDPRANWNPATGKCDCQLGTDWAFRDGNWICYECRDTNSVWNGNNCDCKAGFHWSNEVCVN